MVPPPCVTGHSERPPCCSLVSAHFPPIFLQEGGWGRSRRPSRGTFRARVGVGGDIAPAPERGSQLKWPVRFRTSAMAAPRLNTVTRNFVVPSLGVYAARALSPHVWAENGRLSARGLGARGVPSRRRCGHKGGSRDGRTLSLSENALGCLAPPSQHPGGPEFESPPVRFAKSGGLGFRV